MAEGILFKVGRRRRVRGAELYAMHRHGDGELWRIGTVARSIMPPGRLIVSPAEYANTRALKWSALQLLRVGTLQDWQRAAIHECGRDRLDCGIPFKCAHCERFCGACIGALDDFEKKYGPICNDCAQRFIEQEQAG